jgi:hypothetical protein
MCGRGVYTAGDGRVFDGYFDNNVFIGKKTTSSN